MQDPVYNEPSILPATRTRSLAALQPMDINGKPLIEDGKKRRFRRGLLQTIGYVVGVIELEAIFPYNPDIKILLNLILDWLLCNGS